MKRSMTILAAVLALSLPAVGFVASGHKLATELAVTAAAKHLPAFFFPGRATIIQASVDPDYQRDPTMPQLRDGTYGEHYVDWDTLKSLGLPETRYQYLDLCAKKGLKPRDLGLLPYAIAEATQRLTLAFAEHRAWPNDTHIQEKCLLYAGLLSHLAEDACQPLHTTAEFDGRRRRDGSLPRTGIHLEVDAVIAKLRPARGQDGLLIVPADVGPNAHEKLMPAIFEQIRQSNALVPSVYGMEKSFMASPATRPASEDAPADQAGAVVMPEDRPMPRDQRVQAFARERLSACATFTASLYLTAWADSEKVKLPAWLVQARADVDGPPASQPATATAPAAKD